MTILRSMLIAVLAFAATTILILGQHALITAAVTG